MTVLSFHVFSDGVNGNGGRWGKVRIVVRVLDQTALVHSCCAGSLSKRTEVFGRVAKHRGEAVDSSVVEMVQKQITVAHVLVQLGTFVYPMDEGPIREHLEHPVSDFSQLVGTVCIRHRVSEY